MAYINNTASSKSMAPIWPGDSTAPNNDIILSITYHIKVLSNNDMIMV